MLNPEDQVLSSYDYELNNQLIAQVPTEPRHESRLMIVDQQMNDHLNVRHVKVWDIQEELLPGDLLIVNNTRVIKARLRVRLSSGKMAELLLLEPNGKGVWLCLARPAKKMKPGESLWIDTSGHSPLELKVLKRELVTGGRYIQFPCCYSSREKMEDLLSQYGEVPLPPYIDHNHFKDHEERYQTSFASIPGAVAAPTAGLHLSVDLLDKLRNKGVQIAEITLHVGIGTFKPLEVENLKDLKLHSEWVEVSSEVANAVRKCKFLGGRVIAIGTTSVRAIEAAFVAGGGSLIPYIGNVDLVIQPGYKFGVIDGLLTNFHLPRSSLLLLVSAFIGRKRLLKIYKEAIDKKYRFFSYGDAMFVSPKAKLASSKINY